MKPRTLELCLLVGICIVSAWIVWFLTREWRGGMSPLFEGFQTVGTTAGAAAAPPALQKMMMVMIGPGSGINAADGDVFLSQLGTSFTSPKWEQYTSIQASSLSGTEGRLYATNSASSIYATAPFRKLNEGIWSNPDGGLKQASRDGFHACGVNSANEIWCATQNVEFDKNTYKDETERALYAETNRKTNWFRIGGAAKWISIRNGRAAVIGTGADEVAYTRDYANSGTSTPWQTIQGNLGNRLMKQVVLDDTRIGAIDMEGNIFMADLTEGGGLAADGAVTKGPRWFQVGGKRARYLELRLGRVLILAEEDGLIYYADDYRRGIWQAVPMPTEMKEVFRVNDGWYTYTKVDAEAACKKVGASLATLNQLTTAWKGGANWCAFSWTSDGGRVFPNNEDTTDWCGSYTPGVKGGDTVATNKGDANCYGKKPAKDTNTSVSTPFNSKFWNAPPLAIEFVPFSSVPTYCGEAGMTSTYQGERFKYYSRKECTDLGKGLTDGRVTEYNSGNGECTIVNPTTKAIESASRACAGGQDRPRQTTSQLWDDGSTGNCIFNPDEYKKKYSLTGDTGAMYDHWMNKGLKGGYSPCGNINPSCRWDPDAYYTMNRDARSEQPRDPLEHYKQVGIRNGLGFCKATGQYPLLEALFKLTETRKVVDLPAALAANCTSESIATNVEGVKGGEVFLVDVPGGVEASQAVATCAAEGGAKVATLPQLRGAQLNYANWCTAGWVATSSTGTQVMEPRPYYVQGVAGACVKGDGAGAYTSKFTFTDGTPNTYIPGCASDCKRFPTLNDAQVACNDNNACNGVVYRPGIQDTSKYELRSGTETKASPTGEASYLKIRKAAVTCFGVKPVGSLTSNVRAFNSKAWSQNVQAKTQAAAKQWFCKNRAFADQVFKGPPSSDETYLTRDDLVCFTSTEGGKDVLCRSAQEYRNGEDYTSQLTDSYEMSCNKMNQALVDLSGAMTTIQNIKGSLDFGVTSLGSAVGTLNNVYTKMNCAGGTSVAPEMRAMCNVLDASRQKVMASSQALNSTDPEKEGIMNAILAPIQEAQASRSAIMTTRDSLKCSKS